MKAASDKVCWTGKSKEKILDVLKPGNFLVPENILKMLIDRTPEIVESCLKTQKFVKKIPRDERTVYRAFVKKWRGLPAELKKRILNEYRGNSPRGWQNKYVLLEWLCSDVSEELGRCKTEKRKLRTLINTLDGFTSGMRMQICHDAGRVASERGAINPEAFTEQNIAAIDDVAEAADRRGRASVTRAQQEVCTDIAEGWKALSPQAKEQLAEDVRADINCTATFELVSKSLIKLTTANAETGNLNLDFDKLHPETWTEITRYARNCYGAGTRLGETCGVSSVLTFLLSSIAFIGAPRSSQNLEYAKGHLSRELVQHAAFLLVLSGETQLSVSGTGKLSNLLRALSSFFPDVFDYKDTWREAIEGELGNAQDRRRYVENMQKEAEAWREGRSVSIKFLR